MCVYISYFNLIANAHILCAAAVEYVERDRDSTTSKHTCVFWGDERGSRRFHRDQKKYTHTHSTRKYSSLRAVYHARRQNTRKCKEGKINLYLKDIGCIKFMYFC